MIAMAVDHGLLIGGKEVPGCADRVVPDSNPYTEEVYTTVAAAAAEDVTAAVDAAGAQLLSWSTMPAFDRRAIFGRAAELLEARRDPLAAVMAAEVGSVPANADFNVELAANLLREIAASITAPRGRVLTKASSRHARPGPASAAGRGRLIRAVERPGDPRRASDGRAAGSQQHSGAQIHRFDQGGTDHRQPSRRVPQVGHPRAGRQELDHRLRRRRHGLCGSGCGVRAGRQLRAGCMAADRILVQRSRVVEFVEKIAAAVGRLPAGAPDGPRTVIGPMISSAAAQCVNQGATVLAAGGAPVGAVLPATVLADVFDTDDETAIKSNDTEQGLPAGMFTDNGTRGLGIARRSETSFVHVNDQSIADEPQAPFGRV